MIPKKFLIVSINRVQKYVKRGKLDLYIQRRKDWGMETPVTQEGRKSDSWLRS